MHPEKQHIISQIKQSISEIDPNAQAVLFGSRARGDSKDDSDWDVLILTDYPVNFEIEQRFRHHLFDLELELEEAISTFVYSKSDWERLQSVMLFYQNVSIEGIQI
ncbi:MAG: nucleotidyltransferase domain-containing protein [Pricia sp.]